MLWDDFLNSLHHDWRGDGTADDRLDNSEWLNQWVNAHRLIVDQSPSPEELESLKRLRSFLHRMVQAFVDHQSPSPEDLVALNNIMGKGAVIRQLSSKDGSYELSYAPVERHWKQIEAEIAASFARLLTEGEASRIRICDNPSCLWVYYDDTRNRSKRYCDDKMCGNLMKVRRFRARKKAESGLPAEER
ncbi:CGNR zinc finger domain-containing protein [Cohnella lupini]|uniref:Putative RNA-binding Zn ribbon-like protein n=1 Tax=Cohnella lupini TaxID=1294267 RepID=A0A3D9IXG1_9BACL|nr:ABATE domain-containing protein [Cohnella lupini]RED66199.1 putative RNA-binding Zn ribbon-like protein [Cohnella lupini]